MRRQSSPAILPNLFIFACLIALACISPWLWNIQAEFAHIINAPQEQQTSHISDRESDSAETAAAENSFSELNSLPDNLSSLPDVAPQDVETNKPELATLEPVELLHSQPAMPDELWESPSKLADAEPETGVKQKASTSDLILASADVVKNLVDKVAIQKTLENMPGVAFAEQSDTKNSLDFVFVEQKPVNGDAPNVASFWKKQYPIASIEDYLQPPRRIEPQPAYAIQVAQPQQTARPATESRWHEPSVIIESLNELAGKSSSCAVWASGVLHQIRAIGPAMNAGDQRIAGILDQLEKMNGEVPQAVRQMHDRALARQWLRAHYALSRRIDIWRHTAHCITQSNKPDSEKNAAAWLDRKLLAERISAVTAWAGDSPSGRAWRDFLLADAMQSQLDKSPADNSALKKTARRALIRLTQLPLSVDQRRYLAVDSVAAYQNELHRWAAEPVAIGTLLRDIEQLEKSRLPSDAKRLAEDFQNLAASPREADRRLADRINIHYRNANVRFVFTEQLANSLIPEQNIERMPIRDVIANRPTVGEGVMEKKLTIQMIPDEKRAMIAIVVDGEIASRTLTDAGPARVQSASEIRYLARKPVEIDMQGIRLWPVEVAVQNTVQLENVNTVLGETPLIGSAAKIIVEREFNSNKAAAAEEARQKVTAQVTDRVNNETRQRFATVVEGLNKRIFDPLNSLALDPSLLEAKTTKERVTMRLLIGGEDQLGSFTPRPQAPVDSLASVQVHESLINNGIQRLQLDGRTFMLPDLNRHIATTFGRTPPEPNPENEDVKITFAAQDAISVRCQDGQVIISIAIAKLSKGSRRWKDFQVVAYYKPAIEGRSARLERDGVIHLTGLRLGAGSQLALRGIFSRVLSKKTPWELVPEQVLNQPKLKNAAITQFIIDDGWIGVALTQKPTTAQRTSTTVR